MGQFQPFQHKSFCFNVTAGFEANGDRTGQVPCAVGKFGKYFKWWSCKKCPASYYSDEKGSVACKQCARSETSKSGGSFCRGCDPGFFLAVRVQVLPAAKPTATPTKVCQSCPGGYISSYGQNECRQCKQGYFSKGVNGTRCHGCERGTFGTADAQSLKSLGCKSCKKGRYSSALGATSEKDCNACPPGKYSNQVGNSANCFSCAAGKVQPQEGKTSCLIANDDQIILGSGSVAVSVPQGSFIDKSCDTASTKTCLPFLACPSGWIGTRPPTSKCNPCHAGMTSSNGSLSCRNCGKGKFNQIKGSSKCHNCQKNEFQDQELKKSVKCQVCPNGWEQKLSGQSFCKDLGYLKPSSCDEKQYLNTTSIDPTLYSCVPCPVGGYCVGPITNSMVRNKFGWWRCPQLNLTFQKCQRLGNCLGAPNLLLNKEQYPNASNNNMNESCDVGTVNPPSINVRCSTCRTGYVASSDADQCLPCQPGSATAVIVLAVFVALFVFVLLIALKMKSNAGRRKDETSTMKRTLLTHVQMVSIVMSLQVPWPEAVRIVMQALSSVTSVSAHGMLI